MRDCVLFSTLCFNAAFSVAFDDVTFDGSVSNSFFFKFATLFPITLFSPSMCAPLFTLFSVPFGIARVFCSGASDRFRLPLFRSCSCVVGSYKQAREDKQADRQTDIARREALVLRRLRGFVCIL